MNQQSIKSLVFEVNDHLFPFIKKMLQSIFTEPELTESTHDVIQDTWSAFFSKENYVTRLPDKNHTRATLFVIAKNRTLKMLKEAKVKIPSDFSENAGEDKLLESVFDADFEKVLKRLPENQVFILKAEMNWGEHYNQQEIVEKIQTEYQQKFGSKLSVDNYRQLLTRARRKFKNYWANDNF
ncbi:MAG: hypothetical protein NW226_10785 [Microscillaceae bacterium]|nr:hypothetical protein [Microscillaceae bacterium]